MAKIAANTIVTDAQGGQWRRTQGGHWRNQSTGKLFTGQGDPGTVPGGTPGAPLAPPSGTKNFVAPGTPLETASDVINTTGSVAGKSAVAGNIISNPNQVNPFGTSKTTYDPVTGQPTIKNTLSTGNKGVVEGVQGGAIGASDALQGMFKGGGFGSLFNPSGEGGPAPQSNYETAVFNQLTQGLDKQKAQEGEQLQQTMANRGLPVGSDAYNNAMGEFNKRYDDIMSNARAQAVTGGINTGINAAGTFSQIGQGGYYDPNFQGFNPVQYNQPDVGQVFDTLQETKVGMAGVSAQSKAAAAQAALAKSQQQFNQNQATPAAFG